MNIAHKLYFLRKAHDLKQTDLAAIAGVTNVAISLWESGRNIPKTEALKKICDYFGIDMAKFLDPESDVYDADLPENVFPVPGSTRIPLLGEVCAGKGIIANPETEYVFAPEWVHADLALRCRGDSMINARIFDGDIVYLRKQDIVENGEIAAVRINDDEAVLKRVFIAGDNVILQSENNAYMPIVVPLQAFENGEAQIIGKAVAFTSMLR